MQYVTAIQNVSGLTDLVTNEVQDVGSLYKVTIIGNSVSECEEAIIDHIINRFGTFSGHLSLSDCEHITKPKVIAESISKDVPYE